MGKPQKSYSQVSPFRANKFYTSSYNIQRNGESKEANNNQTRQVWSNKNNYVSYPVVLKPLKHIGKGILTGLVLPQSRCF